MIISCCNKQKQEVNSKTAEADVAAVVEQLMKGFANVDENILKSITADELVYGHSSGKVQNKSEFIDEIRSGLPFRYSNIELSDKTIKISGDVAIVRHVFAAETKNHDGELGSLKIGVMQIWQFCNGQWKLLARQAYKL